MYTQQELDAYMAEIRAEVCSRCIERPPGAPPCGPRGKRCGIELHLAEIVEVAHATRNRAMDPYVEKFHDEVCSHCSNRDTSQCPCPLDPLLQLAIEAIERVDERESGGGVAST